MATPIVYYAGKQECCKANAATRKALAVGAVLLDVALVVSSVVLGVLGLLSVIGMPPVAAYCLIGFGGALFLGEVIVNIVDACLDRRKKKD